MFPQKILTFHDKKAENLLFVFLDGIAKRPERYGQTDGVGHTVHGDKGSSIISIMGGGSDWSEIFEDLKGLSHGKEFKYFDR
jgi:hypothetical protein